MSAPRRTRQAGLTTAALVLAATLAGCGGGEPEATSPSDGATADATASPTPGASDGESQDAGEEATGTPSAEPAPEPSPPPYLPVPAGVVLTEQGADLTYGQVSTVAWQPRQQVTGVLDVSVDAVERTSIERSFTGWQIPPETATATPYFVRATVTNRGDTDLGGRRVPLYVLNASGTLIEATSFASTFRPCRRGGFPETFAPGASTRVCLVYFTPEQGGALSGVSFRPTEEFDPITWTGDVRRLGRGGGQGAQGTQR